MRVVITGGSGFLGRRIASALLAAGDDVVVPSRDPMAAAARWQAEQPAGPAPRWLAADLEQPADFARAVAAERPESLLHAAALVRGTPEDLQRVNVAALSPLLAELVATSPSTRFVLVSSFAVEDPPPTPYSESKRRAEELLRDSGLPWVILRPTLIYGAGDTDNTPRLVEALRAGTMWLPGGGRVAIQPVFVEDVAAACVAAVHGAGAPGRVFRLGGPEPVSVRDFREAVRDATGGTAVIRSIPLVLLTPLAGLAALAGRTRARDVLQFHRVNHAVDNREAREHLDFAPRPLAEGLAATFGSQDRPSGPRPGA